MHYHVDVFAGPRQDFVRGFTLLGDDSDWVVYDEIGLLGDEKAISDPQPLPDALRVALATLYGIVEKPVMPVWQSAPFELLGYDRRKRHTVGVTGLPEKGSGA